MHWFSSLTQIFRQLYLQPQRVIYSTHLSRVMEGCLLECLENRHEPIPLPDGKPVVLGRSPQTKIIDQRCSRSQVEITVKWKSQDIQIKQLGANTSSIDDRDLKEGEITTMAPSSILFFLKGQYPHRIRFLANESPFKVPPDVSKDKSVTQKSSPEHNLKRKHITNGLDEDYKDLSKRRKIESEQRDLHSITADQLEIVSKPKKDNKILPSNGTKHKTPTETFCPQNRSPAASDKLPPNNSKDRSVTEKSLSEENLKRKHSTKSLNEDGDNVSKKRKMDSEYKDVQSRISNAPENVSKPKKDDKVFPNTISKKNVEKQKNLVQTKISLTKISSNKSSKHNLSDEDEEEHVKDIKEKLNRLKQSAGASEPDDSKSVPKRTSPSFTIASSAEKKSVSNPAPSSSKVRKNVVPAQVSEWVCHDKKLYIFTAQGVIASEKIAAFDIDGTIISTQSGRVFPKDISDWKILIPEVNGKLKHLIAAGYKIVFFTNQLGVGRGKVKIEDLQDKFEKVISKLQVPVQVFVSTSGGSYRKPALGMWQILKKQKNGGISINLKDSFYVGDAAGRPENWAPKKKKDFSCSDRLFAINAGLKFYTPEEFFLGLKPASFKMPDFDPRSFSLDAPVLPDGEKLISTSREVVVLVGYQASGKSFFARKYLVPNGYVYVNQDTMKTSQKCINECQKALESGKSVVIDNTNVDPESRARYIECARKAKIPCRCFFFDVSISHCRHNERFREIIDPSHAPINEQIFNSTKKKFKEPDLKEGFSKILKVNFVPKFENKLHAKIYRQFLLEK